ncbi:trypsin-like serine peptidase [Tepidamorphus gemmatus]|nr:trypsin-like serine protease [Tepidamorphus gemmatus]
MAAPVLICLTFFNSRNFQMPHLLQTAPVLAGIAAAMILAPDPGAAQSTRDIAASPIRLSDGLVPEAGLNGPLGRAASRMPLAGTAELERTAGTASGAVLPGAPGASASSGSDAEAGSPGREAFGLSTAPYTTARVAVGQLGPSNTKARTPVTSYPYRATGKIYARWGSSWYVCTASLVKKGVLVTAAHCIHEFGNRDAGWADEVIWIPANITQNRNGPYGVWRALRMYVPDPYFDGSDTCTQSGVVCNNDIATIVLQRRNGRFAGNILGWYAYGWNGFSYRASAFLGNTTTVQITQLGYPAAFDRGYQMQRTDAVGWYVEDGDLRNTQIGSAQTGGSSGGPWLANFGTRPNVSAAASLGSASRSNVVVGVTSYGAVQVGFNRQGASFFGQNREFPNRRYGTFGAGNIGRLMQETCNRNKAFC